MKKPSGYTDEELERVCLMRDSGMTYPTIAKALSITVSKATRMHSKGQRKRWWRENPAPPRWHEGLSWRCVEALRVAGITSRDACQILCEPTLPTKWRTVCVEMSGWPQRIKIQVVNEVRAWMGVEPYVIPVADANPERIKSAITYLTNHGYKIEAPK